jgi:hypothetical protein
MGATPVVQPSGADQAAVTLGNTDGEKGGLTISDPPSQAEVQALRDKAEELADDVRNLSTLVHALRTAMVAESLVKGGDVADINGDVADDARPLSTLVGALLQGVLGAGGGAMISLAE